MKLPKPFKAVAAVVKKAAKVFPSVKLERRKDGARRVMFIWTRKF